MFNRVYGRPNHANWRRSVVKYGGQVSQVKPSNWGQLKLRRIKKKKEQDLTYGTQADTV